MNKLTGKSRFTPGGLTTARGFSFLPHLSPQRYPASSISQTETLRDMSHKVPKQSDSAVILSLLCLPPPQALRRSSGRVADARFFLGRFLRCPAADHHFFLLGRRE